MNFKSVLSNLTVAFLAQGIAMLLSVITSLLVPKVLGVEEYGYWQLFIYYIGYVGFFHFGLNDGVYLINGGKTRSQIDKRSINSQFWFGFAYQGIFAICVCIVASLGLSAPERDFVLFWTALFIVLQNLMSYLGCVFQAMNETKLYSYSIIVERMTFLFPLIFLLATKNPSFEPYVLAYFFSCSVGLVYCIWNARDFFASGVYGIHKTVKIGIGSIRVGVKLMLANTASTLIIGVVRAFVDMKWGIQTFGQLSFSISIVNFILNFIMQASMVLFPALRQSTEDDIKSFFVNSRDISDVVLPAFYLLYFPATFLLSIWLPQYLDSLRYFAYLIPVCVFDGKMNVISTTLFKVRREETRLLQINAVTAAASAIGAAISIYIFGSMIGSLFVIVIAIIGRSVFSEWLLSKELDVASGKASLTGVLVAFAFVWMCTNLGTGLAIVSFLAVYAVFIYHYRTMLSSLLKKLRNVMKS